MRVHLKRLFSSFWPFLGVAVVYVFIVFPALLVRHHMLYNLEPYPDGLLYVVPALNIVAGHGINLWWPQGFLEIWSPPVYQLVLAVGYFFIRNVSVFYVVNGVLGIGSLLLIFLIERTITKNIWMSLVALLFYVCNVYVLWIPSLPMSENINVFLFLLLLYGFIQQKTYVGLWLMIASAVGLIGTRFANIPLVAVAGILFLVFRMRQIPARQLIYGLLAVALLATIFIAYLIAIRQSPLELLRVFGGSSGNGVMYFNSRYLSENLIRYSRALTGGHSYFLWQPYAILSFPLLLMYLAASYVLLRERKTRSLGLISITLFLAQFPLILTFHAGDARYLMDSIPLVSVFAPLVLWKTTFKPIIQVLIVAIVCISLLLAQKGLVREVIANNLLGKSHAWQYEAVQSFDHFFQDHAGSRLITSLPPYLISVYGKASYTVLPLSVHQEFLQKKEYIWGADVPYTNLLDGYETWLEQGKTLYISNAYITQSAEVVADYERFQKRFQLELVSSGCLDACNVYRIMRKQ